MLCFTLSLSHTHIVCLCLYLSLSFDCLPTHILTHSLVRHPLPQRCLDLPSYSWNESQCIRWEGRDWQSLTQTAAFLTELHQLYWKCRQHCDDWRWQAKCELQWGTKKEITHEYHNGNEQANLLSLFARCRVTEKEGFYRKTHKRNKSKGMNEKTPWRSWQTKQTFHILFSILYLCILCVIRCGLF